MGDIEKQFLNNNLPWMWNGKFYSPPLHMMDRTPAGPKYWYRREHRKIRIAQALRDMPEMVQKYRKQRRAAKRLSWFENLMNGLMGARVTKEHIRVRQRNK